jgi:hypothetical protein
MKREAEGNPEPTETTERRAPPRDWDLEPSEDDIARAKLGPRGVPGAPDPARMTPQQLKNTTLRPDGSGPEHTA